MIKKNMSKEELLQTIETGVFELIQSGRYREYLRFMSRFHGYSFGNILLIWMQMPDASRVAGFRKWKEFGRHVKPGEKAIWITAPSFRSKTVKTVDESTGHEIEREERYIARFVTVPVFDVSQTEGDPLPSIVSSFGGDTPLYPILKEYFNGIWPITERELGEACGGYTDGKTITINIEKSEEHRLKTLVHEVMHCKLEHIQDKQKMRDIAELEAETAAFIVCTALGIDTSEYTFGYLTSWSRGEMDVVRESFDRAHAAAKQVIEELEAMFADQAEVHHAACS